MYVDNVQLYKDQRSVWYFEAWFVFINYSESFIMTYGLFSSVTCFYFELLLFVTFFHFQVLHACYPFKLTCMLLPMFWIIVPVSVFFTASRYILVAEDSKYTFSKDHSAYVCMCMHACGYIDIINSHFIHHPGALWMSSLMQCTAWICIDC